MALRAKDIAEMLGVSTATVSLVLNNKPGVGEKRRQEIIQKIKEMDCGYMLKEQRINNGSIGFVVYKREGSIVDESPFFTYILEGINNRINHYGYTLNFLYINRNHAQTEQEHQIKSGGYKGSIIFAVEMYYDDSSSCSRNPRFHLPSWTTHFRKTMWMRCPSTMYRVPARRCPICAAWGTGRLDISAARSGSTALTSGIMPSSTSLRSLGGIFNKEYVVDVGYSEEDVKRDVKKYLEGRKRLPTAFFAENDLIGCSAIRAMQECGYRIPEDISVVGFDNRPISTLVEPQLTTINVPKDIFGPAAVDLLISRLDQGREQSLKVEIGTSLVKRGSVKKITD
ncbi:MAG: LacI family DNA-binding transcriptional regulator [Enterocloster bolteae]